LALIQEKVREWVKLKEAEERIEGKFNKQNVKIGKIFDGLLSNRTEKLGREVRI